MPTQGRGAQGIHVGEEVASTGEDGGARRARRKVGGRCAWERWHAGRAGRPRGAARGGGGGRGGARTSGTARTPRKRVGPHPPNNGWPRAETALAHGQGYEKPINSHSHRHL